MTAQEDIATKDAAQITSSGVMKASQQIQEANMAQARGRNALIAGYLGAGSAIVGGFYRSQQTKTQEIKLAVIKQQRTTFASPIGVVRANTGAGAVFRGVNKIADQMIEESFRSAKQKALEAGEDLARSKELGSLRSINPETGLPEMSLMSTLAPPQEFGSIAQKAYKRVIESRYVSQIEQDFKLKAKELYNEHKDNNKAIMKKSY